MKKTFILLTLFMGSMFSFAQAPNWTWAQQGGGNSGDYSNDIAVDAAGNSFITGWFQNTATFGTYTLTSAGMYDMFLVKYNNAGVVQWAKQAGGPTGNDIGYSIDLDMNGNIYVAGTFVDAASYGSFSVTAKGGVGGDIVIAKFNSAGNALWVQTAGCVTFDDQGQVLSVDKANGKVYVGGYFKNSCAFGTTTLTSSGQSDAFIAKYDTATTGGTPIWVNKVGGTSYDNSWGITADASGNPYLHGHYQGTMSAGTFTTTSLGAEDMYVAKYNAAGVCQWLQSAGGTGNDQASEIISDANGLYLTGWFTGNATFGGNNVTGYGQNDIYVAKYDFAGVNQWVQKAGSAKVDQAYDIATDNTGNVFITGSFDSTATFGTNTVTTSGMWDIFVAKYATSNGNCQWVKSAGGPGSGFLQYDIGYGLGLDAAANIYVTGIIRNTAAFGTNTIVSAGIQDAFVAKLMAGPNAVSETSLNSNTSNLFPNPSNGSFNLVTPTDAKLVQIWNALGQLILEKNCEATHQMNFELKGEGIYCVQIITPTQTITKKLIITN